MSGASDATTAHAVAGQEGQLELGDFSLKDGTAEGSKNLYGSVDYSIGSSESRKHGSA